MVQLPVQMLPAVQHIIFGIFNLAIPNIIAWGILVIVFILAVWSRAPHVFEPADEKPGEGQS
jgi:hypothetical protein